MTRILTIVLATLIALGTAAVLRVYPETVSDRTTWWVHPGEVGHEWAHHQDRCSLANIVIQGFDYKPVVMDAVVIHRRSPSWLWIYAAIVPAFWVVAFFGIRGAIALGRFWKRSLLRLLSSWPRRVLAMLATVSLVCHGTYVGFIGVGGQVGAGFLGSLVYDCSDVVAHLIFPMVVVNHAIVWVCHWVNSVLLAWTSPALGFPMIPRYDDFMGAYSYGGPVWEGLCLFVMAAAWVPLVALVCDAGAAIGRWRRRASPKN